MIAMVVIIIAFSALDIIKINFGYGVYDPIDRNYNDAWLA